MLIVVTSKHCVVGFNVQFEILVQVIFLQETHDSLSIIVILVFGRLFRLRFNQELVGGSNFFLIVNSHLEHHGQVINFGLDLGVKY